MFHLVNIWQPSALQVGILSQCPQYLGVEPNTEARLNVKEIPLGNYIFDENENQINNVQGAFSLV